MSLKNTMAGVAQTSSRFWAERNQREQRILLAGLAVILAAVVYLLLIAPAQSGIARYNRSLPEMRQQVAQLQALVREAASLPQGEATTAHSAPLTKEGLEAALQRRGLKPQSVTVSGDIVRVQFAAASFSSLMEWMAEARSGFQLSVTEANVTAKPTPDIVDASLTLRQQKGQ